MTYFDISPNPILSLLNSQWRFKNFPSFVVLISSYTTLWAFCIPLIPQDLHELDLYFHGFSYPLFFPLKPIFIGVYEELEEWNATPTWRITYYYVMLLSTIYFKNFIHLMFIIKYTINVASSV